LSKWPGKYVIGLTGNIAAGKSVVRRMLEHLGAYGIDADALAHRTIAKGAPGYQSVVDLFGRWILGLDGQIDRSKLGRIVFSEPEALILLEGIIHPLVDQAIDIMVRRATQKVVVVEAVKLIEANINRQCDSTWMVYASSTIQLDRLVNGRKMSEKEALQRINVQSSQEQKMKSVHVVIKNVVSLEDTWRQVNVAWQKIARIAETTEAATVFMERQDRPVEAEKSVLRATPRHAGEIAELLNRVRKQGRQLRQEDITNAILGEKAFLLLKTGKTLRGVIGWQVENLVARTTDIVLDPSLAVDKALPVLLNEMELASKNLQCEASLVFVSVELSRLSDLWQTLGYEQKTTENLGVQAWQEAARESAPENAVLFFKQLRQDRVMKPV
jgi:dephospho-CoA kinase